VKTVSENSAWEVGVLAVQYIYGTVALFFVIIRNSVNEIYTYIYIYKIYIRYFFFIADNLYWSQCYKLGKNFILLEN
jgi:hypothetical protein